VDNGTLIDNDVPMNTPGFFSVRPGAGGQINFASSQGVTAQGNTNLFVNANWIFEFLGYVDVGGNGGRNQFGEHDNHQAADADILGFCRQRGHICRSERPRQLARGDVS
jgi:hypothetical protein